MVHLAFRFVAKNAGLLGKNAPLKQNVAVASTIVFFSLFHG